MKLQLGIYENHKNSLENYHKDKLLITTKKQLSNERSEFYKHSISNERVWMHLDLDMFYVACELLDKPELQTKPCAVGGMAMISTANYVAR